ncbi:hypothetical protein J4448_03805 [Candidatus Woesearchaeota archaeon]|nr:hypothetical protein [Candidatus Woesearchaeota archaeon]
MPIVVKRRGHKEMFNEKKIYGSVYAACASAHYDEMRCEKIAEEITETIKRFVKNKKEIQSIEIRKKIENELKKKDEELAFFYEQHLPNLNRL